MKTASPFLTVLRGAVAVAFVCAGAAHAHPHIFVDTGITLVLDDKGRPAGVEVRWTYDPLYSLLIFEDMEIDTDYDGELTPEEQAQLQGFDMNWIEGFEGDTYVSPGTLGPPEPRETSVSDGQITTVHFRPWQGDSWDQTLTLKAYDPTYYTSYTLEHGVTAPDNCQISIERADVDAAGQAILDELADLPADAPNIEFPEVGEKFADEVRISCELS